MSAGAGHIDNPCRTTVKEYNEHTKIYERAKVTSWLDRGGDINNTSFSKQGHTLWLQLVQRTV